MTMLLFAHDHRFVVADGRLFSRTGGLTDDVFSRYTQFADEVVVLARVDESGGDLTERVELKSTHLRLVDARRASNAEVLKVVCEADLIVARLPSFAGMRIARLAKTRGKSYLVEVVGSAWDALWWHSAAGKVVAPYLELATKRAVRDAPFVLYVTQRFLQSRYPTSGESVGVSDVDCDRIDEGSLSARILRLRSRDRPMILGTCAAVDVRYKGQDQIIRAIGVLKQRGMPDFEYQLVGSGDSRRLRSVAERSGVSDQVRFLGSLNHDEVFKWLDGVDLYVQPSRQEGLPRALVEAMSRGLPCLGSIAGGIPELLDPAWMFSPKGDASDLLASMLSELDACDLEQQIHRNYGVAGSYERGVLEARRSAFFEEYRRTSVAGVPQSTRKTCEGG